uniref:Uncharacterized protein n=1 Tax=Rhizophora mucronata TaxID=61149 RepID=A0A2P2PSH7_RHIMU
MSAAVTIIRHQIIMANHWSFIDPRKEDINWCSH